MEITPDIPQDRQVIESYGEGRFRISGRSYEGSVLVFPDRTLAWPVPALSALSVEALSDVFAADPPVEILLVGCDSMDTGAACRTYNVLLAESRRVAAALIAL